jgi:hypothetical protein
VFFEWKYQTSGFLGRETHETAGQENHECDISTQKKTRVPFSVYHTTWKQQKFGGNVLIKLFSRV